MISTVVALAVIALGEVTGELDTTRLIKTPDTYLAQEPVRCLCALLLAAGGAYGLAALAAQVTNLLKTRQSSEREQVVPGLTVWQQMLQKGRRKERANIVLNVELRDGRILTGLAYSWTATDAENRELALEQAPDGGPILMRRSIAAPPQPVSDKFVLLREDDILGVYGSWVPAPAREPRAEPQVDGREV